MSSTIANWHWRSKGVLPWTREWFTAELTGVSAEGVTVESVTEVEGDSECGMRKSKLVTIFDVKITMTWTATDSAGAVVTGTLVALEVAHDMDEDEYVFTSTCESSSPDAEKFNKIAKKALANKLRPKFQEFPKAMLATHGSDLLAGGEASNSSSGTSTPAVKATTSSTPAVSKVTATKPTASVSSLNFNTSTVKVEGEFQCSSSDLFDFLTNEKKIPLWSRNPATFQSEVGGEISIFGGNITGKVTEITKDKSFSSTWRSPNFPEGHFGVLSTTLVQSSNSTSLELKLSGVPVGMEDETESNLKIYYLNALRSIGSVSFFSLLVSSAIPMLLSIGLIGALAMAIWKGPTGEAWRASHP